MLRQLGAPVIDADALSRALTAPGGAALPALRAHFGDGVFDGPCLNRRALGQLVFGDDQARGALEGILHPLVYAAMEQSIADLADQGNPIAVLEIPLLYETGYDAQVDEVWLTVLPPELQLSRLMARDGLSEADALSRIHSQWPQADKLSRAQVRFDMSASRQEISQAVRAAWGQALRKVGNALESVY